MATFVSFLSANLYELRRVLYIVREEQSDLRLDSARLVSSLTGVPRDKPSSRPFYLNTLVAMLFQLPVA